MDNQFDNIEDSIRNAFEGFELPVKDTDWNAIANGLDKTPVKRGFFAWWNNNNKRNWMLSGLLLLLIGTGSWFILTPDSENKTVDVAVKQNPSSEQKNILPENPIDQNTNSQNQNISGNPAVNSGSNNNSNSNAESDLNNPKTNIKNIQRIKGTEKIQPLPTPTPVNSAPVEIVKTPDIISNPPDENIAPDANTGASQEAVETSGITGSVLKALNLTDLVFAKAYGISAKPIGLPLFKNQSLSYTPLKPTLGWEWYGALQTNMENNKVTPRNGSAEWGGVQFGNMQSKQLNVRFEAGAGYRFRNYSLGAGFAYETGAYQSHSDDTVHVKIPTKLLPYITLQGQTIWLIMKTRDSIIIIHHQPVRQWIEVPLYLQKRFAIGNNLNLTLGATLNPGYLVGTTGDFINPYAFGNVGYSSSYQYGVDPKTINNTGSSSSFTQHFRFGNSLQAGIEKQTGMISWGLQLQTRYYYTPVYKNGVPLQQHTFNYGLNIRIGVRF